MAEAVVEGVSSIGGVEAVLRGDMDVSPEDLGGFDATVVGAPTYRHDISTGIKNLLEEAVARNVNAKGKIGASFGSYGWSGEAPRLVLEALKSRLGMNVVDPPLLIKNAPDIEGLDKCHELGKTIAKMVLG